MCYVVIPKLSTMNVEEHVKANTEAIDSLLEFQCDQQITNLTQNLLIQLLCKLQGITPQQSNRLYNVLRDKLDIDVSTTLEDRYPEVVSSLFSVSQEDLMLALHNTDVVLKQIFDK